MPQLGHDLQLICLEQGHDYSLAVIKAKFLYQLSIFLQVRLLSAVRYITWLSNHNMGMTELYIYIYLRS